MVIRKFTRSEPGSSARSAGFRHSARARSRPRAEASFTPAYPHRSESREWLELLMLRLRAIYGTAVAAEMALREQAAERDFEIANCLRVGVCDPIADQIGELEDFLRPFRRRLPKSERRLRRLDGIEKAIRSSREITSKHQS